MPRLFDSKWWPDQLVGLLIAVNFTLAFVAGRTAVDGTGLGKVLPCWAVMVWFGALALGGLWVVVGTEVDKPRCSAVALALVAVLLAVNGVVTVHAKGAAALPATAAYLTSTIYLLDRARRAWTLAQLRTEKTARDALLIERLTVNAPTGR